MHEPECIDPERRAFSARLLSLSVLLASPKLVHARQADTNTQRQCKLLAALLPERATQANHVVSPVSLTLALALLRDAAAGATRAQLDACVPSATWIAELNPESDAKRALLKVANLILTPGPNLVRPEFSALLTARYGAQVFDATRPGAREDVQRWVDRRTDGLIGARDLKLPSTPSPLTVLSACALKSAWAAPFEPARTAKGRFKSALGTVNDVQMMKQDVWAEYATWQGANVVGLSLQGSQVVSYFLLPRAGELGEATLGFCESLLNATVTPHIEQVRLQLPRFQCEFSMDLRPGLNALGVQDPFAPGRADFSAGFTTPGLFIGSALQRARLSVTEQGLEAGAVTSITLVTAAPPAERLREIVFDRPFSVLVFDKARRHLSFVALIVDLAG